MAEKEERPIQIKSEAGTHGAGILHVTHYEKNERVKRAMTVLGLCWLGAAASIPVVIAHWVLVPGFLIAGPVMAYKRLNQDWVNKQATGTCPHCEQDIKIDTEANETLPKWTYCPACNKAIQLVE